LARHDYCGKRMECYCDAEEDYGTSCRKLELIGVLQEVA